MRGTLSLISLATALVAPVFAIPHAPSHLHLSPRNAIAPHPVTGVPGDVQPRLELRTMAAEEPAMFYLFITAMQKFKTAQDNITSYYAIAGIHGVPLVDYDGVGQCKECSGAPGYCPHNSILFPAWHRAYVALLEQEFYKIAQQVAAQFPNNADIIDAAARIRFPFWDWAAIPAPSSPVLPTVITDQQITITGPNGQETVQNPLYRFDFTNPSNLVYTPFTKWDHTLRHPSSDAVDAISDIVDVSATLNQQQPSLQDQVYQLLSTCEDYSEFSNDDGSSTSPGCANSLESIHNLIHSYLGGPQTNVSAGHMTYLPLAAFDPVFWLHHANVDRLFAMWQVLHSDSYGGSQVASHSTWTIAANSTQDANSPLKPFYKDASGAFWSTNDVRDFESTFHYTYPGFTATDRESNMAKLVNALYGPNAQYVAPSKPQVSSSSSSAVATSTASASSASSASIASATLVTSSTFSLAISTSFPSSTTKGGFNLADLIPSAYGNLFPTKSIDFHIPSPSQILADLGLPGLQLPNLTLPDFPSSFTNDKGSLIQYVANVRFPRWALGGSYIIYLFNGNPTTDSPASFMTAGNLIGIVSALAGGKSHMSGSISSASVPLTRSLQKMVQDGQLSTMEQSTVLPFLKQNLTWRIVGPNGTTVDSAKLHGFQVSCYSSTSQQNSTTALPKWSPFVPQASVTDDKPGGATVENIIKGAVDAIGNLLGGHKDHVPDQAINAADVAGTCTGPRPTQYVTVTRTYGVDSEPTGYNAS